MFGVENDLVLSRYKSMQYFFGGDGGLLTLATCFINSPTSLASSSLFLIGEFKPSISRET